MALRLADQWVWDFWFAVDGAEVHIFYLRADRALQDPDLRHWNVSIGHSVSQDLRNWTTLPPVMAPALAAQSPDSCTTWTGSIILHQDLWHMFYTGTSRHEDGLVQRICLATSSDLHHWEKHSQRDWVPLDPRWYDPLALSRWHDQSWRDPWVVRDPSDGRFHMFITCRVNDGPVDGRGAIGHACSTDLAHWEVQKPLLAPGWFAEMEVPQIERIGARYYLLCSVSARYHSAARRQGMSDAPRSGTIYFVADSLTGPYRTLDDPFLVGDAAGTFYAGRLLHTATQGWMFFAARIFDAAGNFIGEVSDPMPLKVWPDGRLSVTGPQGRNRER